MRLYIAEMVQNAGEIPEGLTPEGLTAHLLRGRPNWSIASFEGDYRPAGAARVVPFPPRIVAHGASEARAPARHPGAREKAARYVIRVYFNLK